MEWRVWISQKIKCFSCHAIPVYCWSNNTRDNSIFFQGHSSHELQQVPFSFIPLLLCTIEYLKLFRPERKTFVFICWLDSLKGWVEYPSYFKIFSLPFTQNRSTFITRTFLLFENLFVSQTGFSFIFPESNSFRTHSQMRKRVLSSCCIKMWKKVTFSCTSCLGDNWCSLKSLI